MAAIRIWDESMGDYVELPIFKGEDGIGVTEAIINDEGKLVVTYSDGRVSVLGKVRGHSPVKGIDYFTDEDKEELLTGLANKIGLLELNIVIDNLSQFYAEYAQDTKDGGD